MLTTFAVLDRLRELAIHRPQIAELLARSPQEQESRGYFHTLRDIRQQPSTWISTSRQMCGSISSLRSCVGDITNLVLTGSGSSEYAGHCLHLVLQNELAITTQPISAGLVLTHVAKALPPLRPGLMVSFARSGDSPESEGALSLLLETQPEFRHLVLTCNAKGKLAQKFRKHPGVHVITLDDATNDRSLVMTSSFTNLVLAARSLGLMSSPAEYVSTCNQLSSIAAELIKTHVGSLAAVGRAGFRRAAYLGSGSRLGAARESALKMLEMTAGSVATLCDSYLGFRHGPMSFTHQDTLLVCFLSSDPLLRAYESDLLQELNDKELGLMKVIVGEDVPRELARRNDLIIECPGLTAVGDHNSAVIHVVAGQLLAFFRCLEEGLRPDSPSETGVINRVVQSFKLHVPANGDGKT